MMSLSRSVTPSVAITDWISPFASSLISNSTDLSSMSSLLGIVFSWRWFVGCGAVDSAGRVRCVLLRHANRRGLRRVGRLLDCLDIRRAIVDLMLRPHVETELAARF